MSATDQDKANKPEDELTPPPPRNRPLVTRSPAVPTAALLPPTVPAGSTPFSGIHPSNLSKVFPGAPAELQDSERQTPIPVPPAKPPSSQKFSSPDPTALVARSGGLGFVQTQRRETPTVTVVDSSTRLLDSLYTTDKFDYTDVVLINWFRKQQTLAQCEIPFFSTPTLAALMLKENASLRAAVKAIQASIHDQVGPERQATLVKLVEEIFRAYSPSVPTIIKLAIHFLTSDRELTEDSFNGLDSKSTILSLTTDLIERYYQVEDHDLQQFEHSEIGNGDRFERPSLGGLYENQPGYLRLRPLREHFTIEENACRYDALWTSLWNMLKQVLCEGSPFIPDVDLALRRRFIHGLKNHPLRQQVTKHGLEPGRLWLNRYRLADDAGIAFEQMAGFTCGMRLDDVAHISIGMDAIHHCLKPIMDLVMRQLGISTLHVPRIMPELKLHEPERRLLGMTGKPCS